MAILERISRNIDNLSWNPGAEYFPVKNRYTAGVAGQRFFEELKNNGKIYGANCDQCGITYVPARIYCEKCFARLEKWVDVGTEGTVFSFTTCYQTKSGEVKDKPSILAAVRIADGLIIQRLEGCEVDEIFIGMPVKAEIKSENERSGGINDLCCFKPL